MLLELRLLLEVDRRAGQLADAAVRLDDAGALQQRDRGPDGAPIDRGQPRLPIGPAPAIPKHLPVDGAHRVAIRICLLDEELLQLAVLGAVEQDAFRALAVAAGAARLLVVLLEAAREVIVDDLADVGEVDAHAECGGGGDDLEAAGGELLVYLLPLIAVQRAVVRSRGQARPRENRGDLDRGPPGAAVDERPAAAGSDPRQQAVTLLRLAAAAVDGHHQVLPNEPGDLPHRFAQAQAGDDIQPHPRRRCRRERSDRRPAAGGDGIAETAVVRAKVVSPAGDAVGLVDDETRHLQPPQRIEDAARADPLRRQIEEAQPAG